MQERSVFWDDVDLGFDETNDVDIAVLPDCNPAVIVIGDLAPPLLVKAINDGDARVFWWRDGNQVVIGVKIYGYTNCVGTIATIVNPNWDIIRVLRQRPVIDLLLINKAKAVDDIDSEADVQYFCLYNI